MKNKKLNITEQLVLEVIDGKTSFKRLYLKGRTTSRSKRANNAIESLKKRGLITLNYETGILERVNPTITIQKGSPQIKPPAKNHEPLDNALNEFINKFPNDATSWSQATDEIRDLCRYVREAYNEHVVDTTPGDARHINSLDFRQFKKPAQWNTEARKMIEELWAKLPEEQKIRILSYFVKS